MTNKDGTMNRADFPKRMWHPHFGWQRVIRILDGIRVRCAGESDGMTRHLLIEFLRAEGQ